MPAPTWLLLIHQIPARPLYLRARVRTLLDRTGAVALKNTVYALPAREGAQERLQAVAREIRSHGGEAFVCEVRFTDRKDEALLTASFRKQREGEYQRLGAAAEALRAGSEGAGPAVRRRLARLRERLERTRSLDYFGAAGRREAMASFQRLEREAAAPDAAPGRAATASEWKGRTWVTRRGVHVDRVACAWFIRRFLDPNARFRFVPAEQAALRPGELGFDLPGGAFTHEGDRCSLETLLAKTGKSSPALERIAGIVHDIDLKDGKFGHPETPGVESLLVGILTAEPDDRQRLERGAALFDDLHRSFARPPALARPRGLAGRRPGRVS